MANMNLFYILKLNTSYITKSDLNVKLSYEEAMLNNYIVALGDNQLFKFIRRLNDQENLIDEIYETKKIIKVIQKQKNSKQNIGTLSQLQQRFKLLSFVPDIISVKADTTVIIVESMKMELEIKAGAAGKIHFVAATGSQISQGAVLAEVQ